MAEGNELVVLNNIKKSYSREVLSVEELTLIKGKIYGIIGPSGSGKSTLLRIINLLTEPDGGKIFFDGMLLPGSSQERLKLQRRMTLVTQKPLLFKSTVRDNVAYGLKVRGWQRHEINSKVDSLLHQLGLRELRDQRADTLSGGEAQRVALARAAAFGPELLLLDEPTANLDPVNVELIEEMIRELNRAAGITVIMVTHNIFQARRIAHEVVFLYEGRIVESGPAEKMFAAPSNEQTRAFIEGRMTY